MAEYKLHIVQDNAEDLAAHKKTATAQRSSGFFT
jgi:hypothetical protein